VTLLRILALVTGMPLLVLVVVNLVESGAAQSFARERGDAASRRAAESRTARWMVPFGVAMVLFELALMPFVGWPMLGIVALLVVPYVAVMMLGLHRHGTPYADWRWRSVGMYLAGLTLGIVIATNVRTHGILAAAFVLVPVFAFVLCIGYAIRRRGAI
jgi:hypothetical protein